MRETTSSSNEVNGSEANRMAKKRKPNPKMQEWISARKRHHLSHAQVQMARELVMNPVKLGKLDEWNERRRVLAARYNDRLAGIPGLGLPRAPQWAEPVWHLYVVQTKRRAELMKTLDAAGIGSLIHYPIPPHLQQAYADLGLPRGSFPLAETLADTVLSLPIGPHMSAESVDRVAAAVRSAT